MLSPPSAITPENSRGRRDGPKTVSYGRGGPREKISEVTVIDVGEKNVEKRISITTMSRSSEDVPQKVVQKSVFHKDAKHVKDWDRKVQNQFENITDRLKNQKQ